MLNNTHSENACLESLELDELQLDQIQGGRSGPAWDLVWAGASEELS